MALEARNLALGGGPQSSGRIRMSYAPWVTAGGAAAWVEFGHTDGIERSYSKETIAFDSDQSDGDLIRKTVKVDHGFKVTCLEMRLDLLKVGFDQPDANVVGGTVYFGDSADREWSLKGEVAGPVGAGTPNAIDTIWRARVSSLDAIAYGKRVLQKLVIGFAALRDDTIVANPGVYGQRAHAA